MIETLQRLIDALNNVPQTMNQLRQLGDTIALYSKILFLLALMVGVIWTLRMPILAIVNVLRYKEMRDIDKWESEAAEARGVIETAVALKGGGPVTEEDLLAAGPVYHRMIKSNRVSRKKHL